MHRVLNGYYAPNISVRTKCRSIRTTIISCGQTGSGSCADLRELARINSDRPYFMLVHVRENSDVARVKSITDRLGSGFEIIRSMCF